VGWAVWKAAAKYGRNIEEREAERWMVDADGGISEADSARRIGGWWMVGCVEARRPEAGRRMMQGGW